MKIGQHESHAAADAYPLLTGADFDNLVDSIEQYGLTDPITLYQGKILDGRNRYAACVKLGIRPRFTEYKGDDPIGYVKLRNNDRRHQEVLSRVLSLQRVVAIAKRQRKKQDWLPNVNAVDSGMVKQIDEDGSPELVEAVHSGDVDAAQAAALSQLEPEQQRDGIERIKAARAEPEKPVRAQSSSAASSVAIVLTQVDVAALLEAVPFLARQARPALGYAAQVIRRMAPEVTWP
jgi:hypothetical protein